MSAFDAAWSLLKALPEYQSYEEYYDPSPSMFDRPMPPLQTRRGTLPPAIARMMREKQDGSRYRQLTRGSFPLDTRIRDEFETVPQGRLQEYPPHPMQGFPDLAPMSGREGEDEYAGRHAQMQRGSVFDPSRKFGTTPEGKPYELSRHERGHEGIYAAHPPKEPLNPDEVAAHLQSIGF
tara:strand:- start:87 stop:623 length:537 start_codon:yes stop_codon:yes gene_type:complete